MSKNIQFCGNDQFGTDMQYKIVMLNPRQIDKFWLDSAKKIGTDNNWQNYCSNKDEKVGNRKSK